MKTKNSVTRRPNGQRKSWLWRIRQLCRFWQPIVAVLAALIGLIVQFWQPILKAIVQIAKVLSQLLDR